jgi:non-ribosomal peptide synthetase component E (peptide arylation enzyme)
VAPLFHAAVVPSMLAPLAAGGSVYVQAEFRPAELLRALDREKISFAVLVPTIPARPPRAATRPTRLATCQT